MTTVYLVRHGEAEGNLYRRGQGHFDGRITPRGEKQIDCLAERFRDIPLRAVYSSDLSRAQQTARGVLRHHPELTLRVDPRLREICMGVWEDQPWGNMEHDEPEQMYNFNSAPERWQVEGGESFEHLTARIRGAVADIASRHDGETIAIVSHGMAIRTLLWDVLRREGREDTPSHGDNTSVSLLEVSGEAMHGVFLNDVSHLPPELSTFARQSWWKTQGGTERNNLRIVPLTLPGERQLYLDCYADAWRFAHGDLTGFEPRLYADSAALHVRKNPLALMKALRGEELAGIVELDTERCARESAGWISLLYMAPAARGHGLAVQLLGHAVSVFRHLGRGAIRLHVSTENPTAIGFYRHFGFRELKREKGVAAPLILMEKAI